MIAKAVVRKHWILKTVLRDTPRKSKCCGSQSRSTVFMKVFALSIWPATKLYMWLEFVSTGTAFYRVKKKTNLRKGDVVVARAVAMCPWLFLLPQDGR
jgi:hypothetical protein